MNKKILLLGFILVVLIAVPLTVYLIGLQTKTKSKAAASTNLSFSALSGPVGVGQPFSINVLLDPGQNQVSFVKLIISYDSSKVQPTSQGIVANASVFPVTLEGPTYNQCTGTSCNESITMSIGTEVTKAIQGAGSPVTIANLNFNAIADSGTAGTLIGVANGTQVLSLASSDQPSENVLSSVPPPANVIISNSLSGTPAPGGGTPTDTPTPAPTQPGGSGGGSGSGTTTTPTPIAQNPICTSLTADNTSTSSAPLTVLFTANGTDPNTGGAINKVTFNFGDSSVQDITSAGGIGTATVNAQVSHTYQTNGLFTATATLFNANNSTSNPTTCSQTISIGSAALSSTPTPTITTNKPLPPTGPAGDQLVILGVIGAVVTALGVTVAAFGM